MPENTGPLTEAVYYILLSLYKPMHGYMIMQNISELSGGRVTLGAGTLYGAINTLLGKNWIEFQEHDDRKKIYIITELGKITLKTELARLEELLQNGLNITKTEDFKK